MYIDIHSHILPSVDDGACSTEQSLMMLRQAWESGTRKIIATPHFLCHGKQLSYKIIPSICAGLQDRACDEGIDIRIFPGQEIMLSPEIPMLYDEGTVGTLNGTPYILIELPTIQKPAYTEDIIYKLQLRGLIPVIAHLERYSAWHDVQFFIDECLNKGVLFQINASAITGEFGNHIKRMVMNWIKKGKVHFIASDAHDCKSRPAILSGAASVVEKQADKSFVERLFDLNGRIIIDNVKLPVDKTI